MKSKQNNCFFEVMNRDAQYPKRPLCAAITNKMQDQLDLGFYMIKPKCNYKVCFIVGQKYASFWSPGMLQHSCN